MFSRFAVVLAGALAASPLALGAVIQKRAVAFYDVAPGGGSYFIDTNNGYGEPLNVSVIEHASNS